MNQGYVSRCSGDLELALELYIWNSRIAAAAFTDTCHLEVALRNAYESELSTRFPDWTIDPNCQMFRRTQGHLTAQRKQALMNQRSLKALADARRGLGASPTHGQVVAATTFGFWTRLTDRERASLFWTPMLHRAFPGNPDRGQVHDLVSRVNRFRNRLAHNEPVFSSRTGLHDRRRDVDKLLNLVSPAVGAFVREMSTVPNLLLSCPVSGLA